MTMTMKQVMLRNLIVAAAMVLAMPAFAGDILPDRGGALAMGCNGADGVFSSDSQGLGCKIGGYTVTRKVVVEGKRCEHDNRRGGECDHWIEVTSKIPGERWAYWMPIGNASGTASLSGNVLTVDGQVCTETECIGLGDRMVIMSSNGTTADVIMDGGRRETITLMVKASGVVHIGTDNYMIHVGGL